MYRAVTRDISVTVTSRFVAEESAPDQDRYFFAYTVEIENGGSEPVQLRSRYWRIVDGRGETQEVRGAGVVGCPLSTPDGTMEGRYTMVTAAGETFQAAIPAFSLDSPHVKRAVH